MRRTTARDQWFGFGMGILWQSAKRRIATHDRDRGVKPNDLRQKASAVTEQSIPLRTLFKGTACKGGCLFLDTIIRIYRKQTCDPTAWALLIL